MTGSASASCSASDSTGTGGASATSTWGAPGGTLHIIGNTQGDTKASAMASYSGLLMVNGASGSGQIQLMISGFSTNSMGNGTPITLIPITLQIDSNTVVQNLPGGPPASAFTVTASVPFGTAFPFSASISATASGVMFHDGTFSQGAAEALAAFPSFTVLDSGGSPISNTTVSVVPEPTSLPLILCGILVGALTTGMGILARQTGS